MHILEVIFICILTIIMDRLTMYYIHKKDPDGIFVVNTLDPKKDVYRLEMRIPFGNIPKQKLLCFRVENEDK